MRTSRHLCAMSASPPKDGVIGLQIAKDFWGAALQADGKTSYGRLFSFELRGKSDSSPAKWSMRRFSF
jgi:hypothetical protein